MHLGIYRVTPDSLLDDGEITPPKAKKPEKPMLRASHSRGVLFVGKQASIDIASVVCFKKSMVCRSVYCRILLNPVPTNAMDNKMKEMKNCPFCQEQVPKAAIICKFCQFDTTANYTFCQKCAELIKSVATICKHCQQPVQPSPDDPAGAGVRSPKRPWGDDDGLIMPIPPMERSKDCRIGASISKLKPFQGGDYGSGVRAQVFEVIVRQAIAGAPWREICAGPMAVNNISEAEVEAEVKRRRGGLFS